MIAAGAPVAAPSTVRGVTPDGRVTEGDGSGVPAVVGVGATDGDVVAGATGGAVPGVPVTFSATGHDDRDHGRGHHPAGDPAASLDAARAALHVGQVERCAVHVAGPVVQAAGQPVLVVGAHRSSSPAVSRLSPGWSWTRDRIAASARLAWDLTVPTEMPRASAVSASERSS